MLVFWSLLILFLPLSPHFQAQPDRYLDRGLQAEAAGHYAQALNIWKSAREALDEPKFSIGREYMRLATEQEIDSAYQAASEMYFWGLSAKQVGPNAAALEEELQFISPFLERKQRLRFESLLEEGNPKIYAFLEGFWKSMDPTPLTAYNERLLEHWERIAYARGHFDRQAKTAYGTDERAIPYIKYGSPDVQKSGTLMFNSSKVSGWIQDIIVSGTMFTAEAMAGGSESRYYKYIEAFVRKAQEYYTAPEYEIWVYRDLLEESRDHTIFVFGSNAETGEYGMVEAVEDFIPGKAFSSSSSNLPAGRAMDIAISNSGSRIHGSRESMGRDPAIDNIRPGLLLQMLYYDQLSAVDGFFGNSFDNINSRATDRGAVSTSLGQELAYEHRNNLQEIRLKSVEQASDYTATMREIPVEVYQYRLLDENNDPYLASFIRTRPQEAYLIDYLYNYDPSSTASINQAGRRTRQRSRQMSGKYLLMHGAQVFSEDWNPVQNVREPAPVVTASNAWTETVLEIPHIGRGARQIFAAELYNRDSSSRYKGSPGRNLFPDSLRGRGQLQKEQPPLLGDDLTSALQMGDLILGYDKSEETGDNRAFPFTIAHEKEIPEGEALVLHLEVYNLEQDGQGTTDFSLNYELQEPTQFMSWLRGKYKTNLELTLNQQTDTPVFRENLVIETRELEPGSYRLQMTVTDNNNGGEAISRSIEFDITGS